MAKKAAEKAEKSEKSSPKTTKMDHFLIPVHEKLSEKEKKVLFEQYNITIKELPKISVKDPSIRHLDAHVGDVIRISRNSEITGKAIYYRGVIDA